MNDRPTTTRRFLFTRFAALAALLPFARTAAATPRTPAEADPFAPGFRKAFATLSPDMQVHVIALAYDCTREGKNPKNYSNLQIFTETQRPYAEALYARFDENGTEEGCAVNASTTRRAPRAQAAPPLSAAALAAFSRLRPSAQHAVLGMLALYAKVSIASVLATPEQRREHTARTRHENARRRLLTAFDTRLARIRRDIELLDARCTERKARAGTYETRADTRRRDRLYADLNRTEGQYRIALARLDATEDDRLRGAPSRPHRHKPPA